MNPHPLRLALLSLCSAVTLAAAPAEPTTYLVGVTKAMSVSWPKNRTINLVCHGHSVPAGYGRAGEVRQLDAYPHLVREGLSQRFPRSVFNIIITAIGGEHAELGAARFERDVLALRPDVVTIDYALNDRSIGLARAEVAWRAMITACLEKNIPVILLTPTADSKADLANPDDPLNQHAAQIRRLAAEYGTGLVDSLPLFTRHVEAGGVLNDLLAQNNHPNRRGHQLVATELLTWFPLPPATP